MSSPVAFSSVYGEAAREEQKRKQAKQAKRQPPKVDPATMPGDIDGNGSQPDMYSQGPEPLPPPGLPPMTVPQGPVRQDSSFMEPQLSRMLRDQTRESIGAFPSDQGEVQAALARKRGLTMRNGEQAPRPEPVAAPQPKQEGGVVFIGQPSDGSQAQQQVSVQMDDQMRAMQEYRKIKDQYERGVIKGPSFADAVDAYTEANPQSLLATQLPGLQEKALTPDRVMEDDAEAGQIAGARANRQQSIKRQNFVREMMQGGPALIYQTLDGNAQKMAEVRARSEGTEATPADFLQLVELHNANYGALVAAHSMFPGMGYDQMAARSLQALDYASQQAGILQGTQITADAAQSNRPDLTPPKDPPVADARAAQIEAANKSADPAGAIGALAQAQVGPGADNKTVQGATDELMETRALMSLQQHLASGGQLSGATPAVAGLAPLARKLKRQDFALRVAPALASQFPDPAQQMQAAMVIYDALRKSSTFSWGG